MDQVISRSDTRFAISNDGFARMNAGRPCYELIREAVSNAFDADGVTEVRISLMPGCVCVEDNAPTGVQDTSLLTTIFMTGKDESPTKRGRKGRGLKELVASAERAVIDTCGSKIVFDTGHTVLTSERTCGTSITVYVESWDATKIDEAVAYLTNIIAPAGVDLLINDVLVKKPAIELTYAHSLETTSIINGIQKEIYRYCDVNLHRPTNEAWLYEMGIPIQKVTCPWSIDVQQRVPMGDARNVVGSYYLNMVYAYTLQETLDILPKTKLDGDWIHQAIMYCSDDLSKRYITKLHGGDKLAVKSSNPAANALARDEGYKLVDVDTMPNSIGSVCKSQIVSADVVAKRADAMSYCDVPNDVADPTGQIGRLVGFMSERIIGVHLSVQFFNKPANFEGVVLPARLDKDKFILSLNVEAKLDLNAPLNSRLMSVLCTQFTRYKNSVDDQLAHDTSEIAGAMATLMATEHVRVAGLVNNTNVSAKPKRIIITCCDCGAPREIDEYNIKQVVRCVPCTKKNRRTRR